MLNEFSMLKQQQINLQNQVSTGLSIQAPSDNPAAMQTTLSDLASQATQQQYSKQHHDRPGPGQFHLQRFAVAANHHQPG